MRHLALLAVALLGLLLGGAGTLAVQRPATPLEIPVDGPDTTTASSTLPEVQVVAVPEPAGEVLLVWSPSRLPESLAERVAAIEGVEGVTEVRAGLLDLTLSRDSTGTEVQRAPEGMVIPVEAIGVEPGFANFLPGGAEGEIATLQEDGVILGSTSAAQRGVGSGGSLELEGGAVLHVGAVLDDSLVGGAEIVLNRRTGEDLGLTTPRYLLLRHSGSRQRVEEALMEASDQAPLRVRGPGETPYLRHGDAVLPQSIIKERFGEFAYRPGPNETFVQDPGWVDDNIVSLDVPILGSVTCHRTLMHQLAGAMGTLEERGLGHLVDPEEFAGCWNPRYVAGGHDISRHAWGSAVDLNFRQNPTGSTSSQDPILVEVMEEWGFTWGGFWLIPDPAHFEYLSAPST